MQMRVCRWVIGFNLLILVLSPWIYLASLDEERPPLRLRDSQESNNSLPFCETVYSYYEDTSHFGGYYSCGESWWMVTPSGIYFGNATGTWMFLGGFWLKIK